MEKKCESCPHLGLDCTNGCRPYLFDPWDAVLSVREPRPTWLFSHSDRRHLSAEPYVGMERRND